MMLRYQRAYLKANRTSQKKQSVDAIYDSSKENLFQLNGEKTKELVISFIRDPPQLPKLCIDGSPIQTIQSTVTRFDNQ